MSGKKFFLPDGKILNNMKKREGKPVLSEFTEEGLPMWVANSVIRHRDTGKALLVIHTYRNCTIVVSLEDKSPLVAPMALLEREYHYWSRDVDMENDDPIEYEKDWHYRPVVL
jgi:hypothetical protein